MVSGSLVQPTKVRERNIVNIENKVEDVTQALVTMARGSTKSDEVNELTKQIITELDCYVPAGSEIIVATTEEDYNEEFVPSQDELNKLKLTKQICNIFVLIL